MEEVIDATGCTSVYEAHYREEWKNVCCGMVHGTANNDGTAVAHVL